MADNIVGSLFGVDPSALQRQQQLADQQTAYRYAQLDPMQQAKFSQFSGAAQLARGTGSLLGLEDPELAKASMAKKLAGQFDITSPEGLRQYAAALAQNGAPDLATMAAAEADKREQTGLGLQKTRADIAISERKVSQDEKLREELLKLGDNPTEEQYLRVFRQFGSPDQQAKAIEASIARRQKAAGAGAGIVGGGVNNNGVKVGTFDKTGRYTSPTGRVFTAKAVEDAQASHDNAQDLVDRLQNLTDEDIKAAYGSAADYTTMTGGKLLGPTKTLNAQTKINEIGIRSVLTNLQKLKGASSDKEMAQMIKDFPGYQADPDVMRQWVDRATRVTNKFLARSEQRFGFDTEYAEEGRFTSKGKTATGKAGSSRDNPIKLD